ncbi:c-type cytochrome [Pseudomonas chlororaphis]|uniref:c-type cytochrome n=1 Tax=Pseudomonas chlororaphis TaxID=587753 RepID=UPI002367A0CD|nr:cytochrome c5 family protein [Pseudomonas chlororaphis]WDH33124.1 cytochrome c5 family protein [Pseudomonas chlororaphis]WDH39208.1 cytochrome c5 family protein [Pseudomonas chlororaphis]
MPAPTASLRFSSVVTLYRLGRVALWLALGGLLVACGDKPAPPAATLQQLPDDPALARIYDSSCKLCHANPASGAPLTGDIQAWRPRIAQGTDTLLDHSINGYNGMPPMGLCMQCSEEQFLGLIRFMSAQDLQ